MTVRPQRLFKYQRIHELSLSGITDASVWASLPGEFNDPFDCALQVVPAKLSPEVLADLRRRDYGLISELEAEFARVGLTGDEADRRVEETYRSAMEDAFTRACSDLLGAWGVICLSAVCDDILMWSHYTDGHRGICLEFDSAEEPFAWAKPVQYVERAPEVDPRVVLDRSQPARDLIDPLVRSKFLAWRYEHEWRVIMKRGRGPVKYYPRALTAVYFGAATTPEQRERVVTAVGSHRPSFFLMERDARGFGLTPRPLTLEVGARTG